MLANLNVKEEIAFQLSGLYKSGKSDHVFYKLNCYTKGRFILRVFQICVFLIKISNSQFLFSTVN